MTQQRSQAKIIQFPNRRTSADAGGDQDITTATVRDISGDSLVSSTASLEDIYPELGSTAPEFYTALSLIGGVSENLDESALRLKEGNVLQADDLISRAILDLPRIFPLIVEYSGPSQFCTSVFHALINKRGQPLEMNELHEIQSAFHSILREPFMGHDRVIDLLERLDSCGLDITPNYMSSFIDEFADEGIY